MLFNSYVYALFFLPTVAALFFLLGRYNATAAAASLVLASLLFYSYWDPRYLVLLISSALFNYGAGIAIGHSRFGRRRWFFAFGAIAADLALLGYFKYADFFLGGANAILGAHFPTLRVILPLGISFFTFTQIAFIADCYREGAREYRFIHYLLFVTYFPHLIAGPIIHHKQMMPQFALRRTYVPDIANISSGSVLFFIGLSKKVLLADTFAEYATPVFNGVAQGGGIGFLSAWLAALAYTLQIYFDFSGYSDMAIGSALMCNIVLPLNFNSPYKAADISDFWRRWHVTLSRFLRDYLYIPLGGNRMGEPRRYLNLLITMLLGGLWHGANWTFVVWGGLHGLYLVVNHAWVAIVPRPVRMPAVRKAAGIAVTFLAVIVAWVFFRASNLQAGCAMLSAMLRPRSVDLVTSPAPLSSYGVPDSVLRIAIILGSGLLICLLVPNSWQIVERMRSIRSIRSMRSLVLWRMVGAISVLIFIVLAINASRSVSEFIYFNF